MEYVLPPGLPSQMQGYRRTSRRLPGRFPLPLHIRGMVAFFFPQHMRAGGRMPAYELYVDKAAGKFLTYDRGLGRWG